MDDRSGASWGKFSDAAEAELPQYRALSGLAVVGLLLGFLSALAIVHVGLSFIGGAAVLCCLAALVRIASAPSEISGRGLALAGLVLAILMTTAGLAREVTEQRLADIQSRTVAVQWFEYLKQGQPHKAKELENSGTGRRSLDETLWDEYLSSATTYEGLETFVAQPEILALLTLGDRADVRHYQCLKADSDSVTQVYAVTYTDDGARKSFLVEVFLKRNVFPQFGTSSWRVEASQGPWDPNKAS